MAERLPQCAPLVACSTVAACSSSCTAMALASEANWEAAF
jgi:hypothetical protein